MQAIPEEKLFIKFLMDKCTPKKVKDVIRCISSPEDLLSAENQFDSDITLMKNSEHNIIN